MRGSDRRERQPGSTLSRRAIGEVAAAARALEVDLAVVSNSELHPTGSVAPELQHLANALIGAGAMLHAPALAVHRRGELKGSAILGYKTADAYESLISDRLRGEAASASVVAATAGIVTSATASAAPPITVAVLRTPEPVQEALDREQLQHLGEGRPEVRASFLSRSMTD